MIKKITFYSFIYILISVIPFVFIAYPSLMGEISIQAYSDALTYERLAKDGYSELVSISFNLLGPILILKAFDYNYIIIYLFNLLLFFLSIKLLLKYYDLNHKPFLFFLLINPMTLFALFSVNKEILLLFNIVLILIYIKNKSFLLLLTTIIFGFLIKWQMAFYIIIVALMLFFEKFYKNRLFYILSLLVSISIIFPLLSNEFENVIAVSTLNTDKIKGSGLFPLLVQLQSHLGGYILAFPPKLLQLLFGLLGRFYLIIDWSDFWNNFIQTIYSLTFLMLVLSNLYRKTMKLNNDIFYLAVVFSMIFAITPIFSVRYFYPLYILLVVLVSQKHMRYSE